MQVSVLLIYEANSFSLPPSQEVCFGLAIPSPTSNIIVDQITNF